MSEPQLSMSADDDLPRTLRRERDAQQARAKAAANPFPAATEIGSVPDYIAELPVPRGDGVTVSAIDMPFGRMVGFFVKAALAAIPALILLAGLIWGMGKILSLFFPALVKMQILIHFPN
jgi:hypothetical protein